MTEVAFKLGMLAVMIGLGGEVQFIHEHGTVTAMHWFSWATFGGMTIMIAKVAWNNLIVVPRVVFTSR